MFRTGGNEQNITQFSAFNKILKKGSIILLIDKRIKRYLDEVEERLISQSFSRLKGIPDDHIDFCFHKREFQLNHFGFNEIFFMFHIAPTDMKKGFLKEISKRMFQYSLKKKLWIPRSMGDGVTLYSVFIMKRTPEYLSDFIRSYNPKHYASFEYPIIVDIYNRKLHFFQGTPVWGMIYYREMRENLLNTLNPEGWEF